MGQLSLCGSLVSMLLLAGLSAAQIPGRAEVTGRIMDETRSVVAGVSLTLSHDETGYKFSRISSSTGDFVFQFLQTGSYTLTAEFPQFQTLRIEHVRPALNQRLDLGALTLRVGSSAAEVNVVAAMNLIDTSSAALRTVVTESQMREVPLLASQFWSRSIQSLLLAITPGASDYGIAGATGQMSINGSPIGGIGFSLNGIDNSGFGVYAGTALSGGPNQDAISEFSVVTQTFNADSGNMAAQVSLETKSGTNDYHLQLRGQYLDPTVAARDFFNTVGGYRAVGGGLQFSGPVTLPGLYKGRSKTFFFFDTELQRSRVPFTYTATVLSAEERSGDFSALPSDRWPIDPTTGERFPGGRIPLHRILPQSRQFIDEVAQPVSSGRDIVLPWTDRVESHGNTARVDHRFSQDDSLQLNLYEDKWLERDPIASMQEFYDLTRAWTASGSIRYTHTLSSRAINSFAFGRSHYRSDDEYSGKTAGDLRATGFNITSNNADWGYPWIVFQSGFGVCFRDFPARCFSTGNRNVSQNALWTIKDDLAFVRGAHNFKLGGNVRAERDSLRQAPSIQFRFSDDNPFGTGNEVANFLLGLPTMYSQSAENEVSPQRTFTAFYFQDDFKARPGLTLNLGLRYEIAGAWSDAGGHRAVFRPDAQSKIVPNAPAGMLFPGDTDPLTGQMLEKAVNPADANNWAPRVGVAYSPSGAAGFWRRIFGAARGSIRAGYGIYYLASSRQAVYDAYNIPPWTYSVTLQASMLNQSGGNFLNPWGRNADPYGLPTNDRPVSRPVTGITFVEHHAREPYQQQWSLSISRQFPGNLGFSMSYVGNAALHVYRKYQVNPGVVTATATQFNVETRRKYSDFGAIWALSADGQSNYNALQIEVNRRFASSFQFNASYVWSKAIDNAGTSSWNQYAGVADRDVTPRARSNYDRTHQFVFLGAWELPSFPVMALRTLLSGWQLTSLAQMRSGIPLNIVNPFDSTLRGGHATPAGFTGDFRRINPREVHTFRLPNGNIQTGHFFFDPTAFVTLNPQAGKPTVGTLGRNAFTGLGINNVDVSLLKSFSVGEQHRIQVRVDTINVFNHAQFLPQSIAAMDSGRPVFAQTNRTTGPRRFQFVVKYSF